MKTTDRLLIEQYLNKLPFVAWDRYISSSNGVEVYGWIDREQDSYKDFITLHFFIETDGTIALDFSTSSAKHSLEIHKLLYGKEDGHNDCLRVESMFNVTNYIKLKD